MKIETQYEASQTKSTDEEIRAASRRRSLFLGGLFIVIFLAVRIVIIPINDTDYTTHIRALHAFYINHETPYSIQGYFMPPWAMIFLWPLMNQPVQTWLALSIAIFVTLVIDTGHISALLMIAHPVFVTMVASSNPEWLLIGSGLWIMQHNATGWKRALAWLLMVCKPQTTFLFLIVDGIAALRQRDWLAFILSGVVALPLFVLMPGFFQQMTAHFEFSVTVFSHYGFWVAGLVTLLIIVLRQKRWRDLRTLGLILAPIWAPYMIEYSLMSILFTMRRAGWLRTGIFVVGGYLFAYLFWRDYHVAEQLGAAGMVLLAAALAPSYLPADAPESYVEIAQNPL